MKGDFTRSTFRPDQHYSGVRMQQGRVQLDADWNEQVDIATHRIATETADTLGGCGGPLADAGFAITGGPIPTIGRGRYYVAGTLCENEAVALPLDQQPDLPVADLRGLISPPHANIPNGLYLAYLDVWQRHLTVLEDPAIREVALGGPDTATRTKTVWQVKLLGPLPAPLDCTSEPALWKALLDRSGEGKLSAQADQSPATPGPCVVPPGAGYRRLENQLYRVEVHEVDGSGKVNRLKWSRDNGAILTRWIAQEASAPQDLIVASSGRDEVLRFTAGGYAEVCDDQRELRGEAGVLVRLANAQGQVLTLDSGDPNAAKVKKTEFPDLLAGRPNHPKVRNWDGTLDSPAVGAWLDLEDGVQVRLDGGRYQVGDYWLIPARTATGEVEWPRTQATPPQPIPQPRAGITHDYCRLAVLNRTDAGFAPVAGQDCRRLFPPLTGLVTLLYAGGDGQEALPGASLPQTLRVRVANGQAPVVGALVRFQVTQGGGTLAPSAPVATTAPDGIAECTWTLGAAASGAQRVEAVLLNAGGVPVPGQVVRFGANLSLASRVAYDPAACSNLAQATTVQQAIDLLCQNRGGGCCVCVGPGGDYPRLDLAIKALMEKGERDLCICLLHGDHELAGLLVEARPEDEALHLQVVGCGAGSRLIVGTSLRFVNLATVACRNLAIETSLQPTGALPPWVLRFERCAEVRLESCQVSGYTGDGLGALLSIVDADRVRLHGNGFEALLPGTLAPVRDLFAAVAGQYSGHGEPAMDETLKQLVRLYDPAQQGGLRRSLFRKAARELALQLTKQGPDARKAVATLLQQLLSPSATGNANPLTPGETLSYFKLYTALGAPTLGLAATLDLLLDIRRTAVKARPGTAIVLGGARRIEETKLPELAPVMDLFDDDDLYLLDHNDIVGLLSLYGPPASPLDVDKLLTPELLGALVERLKGEQLRLSTGLTGTLQLRGNQLVRVAVSRELVEALVASIKDTAPHTFAYDLFGRCQWSDNVLEGDQGLLMCIHLTLHGNELTGSAAHPGSARITANLGNEIATVVADSALYVGNHGVPRDHATLRNVSRLRDDMANQELSIT